MRHRRWRPGPSRGHRLGPWRRCTSTSGRRTVQAATQSPSSRTGQCGQGRDVSSPLDAAARGALPRHVVARPGVAYHLALAACGWGSRAALCAAHHARWRAFLLLRCAALPACSRTAHWLVCIPTEGRPPRHQKARAGRRRATSSTNAAPVGCFARSPILRPCATWPMRLRPRITLAIAFSM